MTDLQMGLIGLGGAAVVGVLAYNKWQEHKHRKLAEELLSARQADVLLDEPVADDRGDEYAGKASPAIGIISRCGSTDCARHRRAISSSSGILSMPWPPFGMRLKTPMRKHLHVQI